MSPDPKHSDKKSRDVSKEENATPKTIWAIKAKEEAEKPPGLAAAAHHRPPTRKAPRVLAMKSRARLSAMPPRTSSALGIPSVCSLKTTTCSTSFVVLRLHPITCYNPNPTINYLVKARDTVLLIRYPPRPDIASIDHMVVSPLSWQSRSCIFVRIIKVDCCFFSSERNVVFA
jgi:hypothetical protein